MAKAESLFKAYMNERIPEQGGFIVNSFFDKTSTYSIYEITAFANVRDIYETPEGLVFRTDGNRVQVLVEPSGYAQRYIEPVHREEGKSIPFRFSELDIFTSKKHDKVMVSKEPIMLYSTFTILRTSGENFSYLFYLSEDVYVALRKFMADSLYNDCKISREDAMEVASLILQCIKKCHLWQK